MWLDLAALKTSDAEIKKIAVKGRDFCAALMTPGQIAEAQRLASEWKPK
jgi:hypothetical protein